jgi:hypothetical protein
MAATSAIAGVVRRVLIGVPSKDIPDFLPDWA